MTVSVFFRPSDRALVYLACPVEGCQQFWGFEPLEDLQKHIKDGAVRKASIKLTSDAEVIDLCSVLPGEVGRGGVDVWPVKRKEDIRDEASKEFPGNQSKNVEIIDLTGDDDQDEGIGEEDDQRLDLSLSS